MTNLPEVDKSLTRKQLAFIDFLRFDPNRNQTQAYLKAYPETTPDSATSSSCVLMKRDSIRSYIAKLDREDLERKYSAERIIEEIGRLSTFNIQDLYTEDGELIPIHELPREVAACISAVDVQQIWGKASDGEEANVLVSTKVKTYDKAQALKMAGQAAGIFERHNKQKNQGLTDLVDMMGTVAGATRGLPNVEQQMIEDDDIIDV